MSEDNRKVALVTGASSGIGKAIAERLLKDGWRVFGTSRKAGPAEGGIERVALDVTDEASVKACVAEVLKRGGGLDLVVNNAGYLQAGAVEEVSVADAARQFETNYFGAVRVMVAALPALRARPGSKIVNITSLAGIVPLPFWGHYNASKAALESISETLRQELKPFGVSVSAVEPGAIKTPFYAGDRMAEGLETYRPWRSRFEKRMKEFENDAPGPEVVAEAVAKIAAAKSPALRYRVTREAHLFNFMRNWFPAGLFESGLRKGFRLDQEEAT